MLLEPLCACVIEGISLASDPSMTDVLQDLPPPPQHAIPWSHSLCAGSISCSFGDSGVF